MKFRVFRLAALAAAALALLLAPIHAHARAAAGATDRHEVPTFVLERIELATDAHGHAG